MAPETIAYVPDAVVAFCQERPLLIEEVITTGKPVQSIFVLVVRIGAEFTIIVIDAEDAQPEVGVKVYAVVDVLFINAGDHVPVTLLVDMVGNGDNNEPAQIGAT